MDKLDGKIYRGVLGSRSSPWNQEEQQIQWAIHGRERQSPEKILDGARILELANKAYLREPPAEQKRLLRIVLSNCKVDATSVYPTYRKPFDLIFQQSKMKYSAPGESRTPDPLLRSYTIQNSKCRRWCRLRGSAPFISPLNWTDDGPKLLGHRSEDRCLGNLVGL